MSGDQTVWISWAQQLPALGMILVFLGWAGRGLIAALRGISDKCHETQLAGHEVIKKSNEVMGACVESNRAIAGVLVEVKTLLIKKNGSRS